MIQIKYSQDISYLRPRDEALLKELVPGATSFRHLYHKFKAYFPSEHAMRQQLAQCVRNSFMQSQLYVNHSDGTKFALYVLNSAGIEYLKERGYCADEIRTLLPSQHTAAHELVVVDIVRWLRRESIRIPYDLKYYDDPTCRAHKKPLGLKSPIPDLLVDLKIGNVREIYRVNIEVHMGTVPVLNVVDKSLKQECQTLYVCNTGENMDALRSAMLDHSQLKGMVYFSLINEFCTSPGGIFGSNYAALDGRLVSLFP